MAVICMTQRLNNFSNSAVCMIVANELNPTCLKVIDCQKSQYVSIDMYVLTHIHNYVT